MVEEARLTDELGNVLTIRSNGEILSDIPSVLDFAQTVAKFPRKESDGIPFIAIAKNIQRYLGGELMVLRDPSKADEKFTEAFCPTGKGGKRDPHCSPKNKGTGKKSRLNEITELKSEIEVLTADDPNAYEEPDNLEGLEDWWEQELKSKMEHWKQNGTLYAIYKENNLASTQRLDEAFEIFELSDGYTPEMGKEFNRYANENWVREYRIPSSEVIDDFASHLSQKFGASIPAIQELKDYGKELASDEKEAVAKFVDGKKEEFFDANKDYAFGSSQKRKALTWVNDGPGSFKLDFTTSDSSEFAMEISTNKVSKLGIVADLVFVDSAGSVDITGKGGTRTALEVFKKVTASSLAYLENVPITAMHFSSAQPSRTKLYERLVRTAATENTKYTAFRNYQAQGGASFFLVRTDKLEKFKEVYRAEGYTVSEEQLADPSAKTFVKIGEAEQKLLLQLVAGIDDKWFEESAWAESTPAMQEAFCPTGKGGKIRNDCPPKSTPKAPPRPVFTSDDQQRNASNDAVVDTLLQKFDQADYDAIKRFKHPSPKVQQFQRELQRSLVRAGVADDPHAFYSTADRYMRNGKYTPERKALHQSIYQEFLSQGQRQDAPVFMIMGGGPASGKSQLLDSNAIELPESMVRVDADALKEKLPEYGPMVSSKDTRAAAYTHDESAYMAKELAKLSTKSGFNTLFDGTGNGSYEGLKKKIDIARSQGIRIVANYCTTDLKTAHARNIARAKKDGRMVPPSFLEFSHRSVSQLFPKAIKEDLFDEAHLYDTTGTPKKILTYRDGNLEIHDSQAWEAFKAKGGYEYGE
jgi:predicted ABC-type ATPase